MHRAPFSPQADLAPLPQALSGQVPPGGVPCLSHPLSAGFPSPADEGLEEPLDLNAYLVRHRASTFLFTVRGDSMNGMGILPGDKVLVDRALAPCHGDVVVAAVNGEYTLKRLQRWQGQVALMPENPAYAPIVFAPGTELHVWGVMVGLVRRCHRK